MDNESILLTVEELKDIKNKLLGVKVMTDNKEIKKNCSEIIELVDSKLKLNQKSVSEIIYEKMRETKVFDPDLSADLYILYRKLVDGKISEEEALVQLGNYANDAMQYYNKKIY